MGNKVSVVRGVKSDHFYNQQNGINEIWVGDVEIISRLPFGDSDQEQSSWPPGGVPKIPWHQFIIPLHKRDEVGDMSASNVSSIPTCDCYLSLPASGYYGLFTGMPPGVSYQIGAFALFGAIMLGMIFVMQVALIFSSQIWISRLSLWDGQSPEFKLQWQREYRKSILIAVMLLASSILLAVLGLPALAAGVQHPYASFWILNDGTAVMFYTAIGFCVGYIRTRYRLWRSANTNQAEVQDLQTVPATCEGEKV
ncbi:unnamed protein product [Penicillium salamii]|uniref:Uncharacterized protein n=1 Tax=Penicillium salamii TaxID=1612424 RepID=A0A9W4JVP4_9EURO|nr:unnamed protein product [Penicillium salamii]CAG8352176.1 unnamed protein product [Penicillium salamii]CAG8414395.1 unnamed protein product [Penicillium salamii]